MHRIKTIAAIGRAVRAAWLIAGLTLLLFVALELAYRAQRALRGGAGGVAFHPDSAQPWYGEFRREIDATTQASNVMQWYPYSYWRHRPFAGTHVNVDSSGVRVTPQPAAPDSAGVIALFGGSVMWGDPLRDSATIPAQLARLLAAEGRAARVVNYGESGYVMAQGAAALAALLRDGQRFQAVVFLDGVNDVEAAIQNGRAGWPQNESNRARDFAVGRDLATWHHDVRHEARAFARLAGQALGRSLLVRRIMMTVQRPPATPDAALGAAVGRQYAAAAAQIEALAQRHGFTAYYVWQPAPASTGKRLSAAEQAAVASVPAAHQQARRLLFAEARRTAAPLMRELAGGRFQDASALFDADTGTVFVDAVGHVTEAGAGSIARVIGEMLRPAQGRPLP